MKPVEISEHARLQMGERGVTEEEVKKTVEGGEMTPAKKGRKAYRLNFQYNGMWSGKHYRTKQVMAIVAEDEKVNVVVTVYSFYF